MARRKFVCGNWKMFKTPAESAQLVRELRARLSDSAIQVAIAPPFTSLESAHTALTGSPLQLYAQNCHFEKQGAFTGEICRADARGARLPRGDPRAQRAAHALRRDRRAGGQEAARRARGAAGGDRLRRRDAAGARGEPDLGGGLAAAARGALRPRPRIARPGHHRLRAGVGHRHRAQRHRGASAGGPRADPGPRARALHRADRGRDAHPVRRERQAGERRRAARPARRRRRAGGRREPQGRRLRPHRRRRRS